MFDEQKKIKLSVVALNKLFVISIKYTYLKQDIEYISSDIFLTKAYFLFIIRLYGELKIKEKHKL